MTHSHNLNRVIKRR